MPQIKKILIAVDNSSCSMRAAKKGFALANQLNASVGLLFVIDRDKETVSADLGITPEESQTVLLRRAEETLDQLVKMYGGTSEIFRFTPEGIPKEEILAASQQWNADLIVMGTHGHTGLQHLLMGSVAEYVIHHSTRPVMVVSLKTG
jgi:nucleotide-binding universal stress UspA family protein